MAELDQRTIDTHSSITAPKATSPQYPSFRDIVIQFIRVKLNKDTRQAFDINNHAYDENCQMWRPKDHSRESDTLHSMIERRRKASKPILNLDEIYARSEAAQQSFLEAIKEYHEKADPSYRVDVDFQGQGKHDWKEVIEMARRVERKYSCDDVKGTRGGIRKKFRDFCKHAKSAQAFVALLPTQSSYESVVCGGLKLLFGAFERLGHVRRAIQDALEEIPVVLNEVEDVVELYVDDRALHEANSELYVSVLEVLERMLKWFKENAIKKSFKATVRPGDYEEKLLQGMETMKKKVEQVNRRAHHCQRLEQRAVLVNLDKNNHEQRLIKEKLETLDKTTELFQSFVQESLKRSAEAQTRSLIQVFLEANTNVQERSPETREQVLRRHDITNAIGFNSSTTISDCKLLFGLSGTLALEDQNRASELMQDPRLREWIACDNSSSLLVNGQSEVQRRPPVSFLCATLVECLHQASRNPHAPVVVLSFFCGEHLDLGSDRNAHPIDMIMALSAQLLDVYEDFDMEPIRPLWHQVQILEDVKNVFKLFNGLLKQLPPETTIFCVIDGISYYEDPARQHDLVEATKRFVSMTRKRDRPVVKLLMTSTASCSLIWKLFDQREILDMGWKCSSIVGYRALEWTPMIGGMLEDQGDTEEQDGEEHELSEESEETEESSESDSEEDDECGDDSDQSQM